MKKLQYKEIKQTFIDFLKDYDAYTRFVVYLCHPKNKDWYTANFYSVNRTFSAYVYAIWSKKLIHVRRERHYQMERLISCAFLWRDTPEGGLYWLHLSNEWKKVLYNKYVVLGTMYTP